MFVKQYGEALDSNEIWNAIQVTEADLYQWAADSTYIQEPPFLVDLTAESVRLHRSRERACSPCWAIPSPPTTFRPPARSLKTARLAATWSSRACNRATSIATGRDAEMIASWCAALLPTSAFATSWHREPRVAGHATCLMASRWRSTTLHRNIAKRECRLIVIAGTEYGTGSSRDWAAKGTYLLGVRAVIAASYERIHRSNLVGMGVLPLEFAAGDTWQSLGITGEEVFDIPALNDDLTPRSTVEVRATAADGTAVTFQAIRPHRYACRNGLLPQRRHPANGPAEPAVNCRRSRSRESSRRRN